jgi:hypothetical protein
MTPTTTLASQANPHGLKDGDLLLLLALSVGNPIDVIDGEMRLPDPAAPSSSVPVPPGALDRLEDAGMVAIEEAGAVPTDRGKYWLDRWLTKKVGVRKGRFVVTGVRPTGVNPTAA